MEALRPVLLLKALNKIKQQSFFILFITYKNNLLLFKIFLFLGFLLFEQIRRKSKLTNVLLESY
jgi:hypothetical protein